MQKEIEKIINAIDVVNNKNFKIDDPVIKKTFNYILNIVGQINPGAFELIYTNAIINILTGYQRNIENNQNISLEQKEYLTKKIKDFPNITYKVIDNDKMVIALEEQCIGGGGIVITFNFKKKTIFIATIESNYITNELNETEYFDYLSSGDNINSSLCYKYSYLEEDVLHVNSDGSLCTCYYDKDGIEIKREISRKKNIPIENKINEIETFMEFYDEQSEDLYQYEDYLSDDDVPEEIMNCLIDEYGDLDLDEVEEKNKMISEKYNLLKQRRKKLLRLCEDNKGVTCYYTFIRDDEDFPKIIYLYREKNKDQVISIKTSECYLLPNSRLYQLNHFTKKQFSLNDYIEKLSKNNDNDELKEISCKRLRAKTKEKFN